MKRRELQLKWEFAAEGGGEIHRFEAPFIDFYFLRVISESGYNLIHTIGIDLCGTEENQPVEYGLCKGAPGCHLARKFPGQCMLDQVGLKYSQVDPYYRKIDTQLTFLTSNL